MPRPRKYASNAERQAAYRDRLKKGDVTHAKGAETAAQIVTRRVMASEAAAK